MAIKKESGRQRSKAISILETIQNQEYRTAGDTNSENLFSQTEVGMEHPINGGKIHFLDNGNILLKDRKNNGFFINSNKNSILLNSKTINFKADRLNIRTRPDGFRLNGYYLNPEVLQFGQINIAKDGQTKTVSMFIEIENDNEFEDLLREFKIL